LAPSLGAAGGFDKAASVITLFNKMNNGAVSVNLVPWLLTNWPRYWPTCTC
jgi:hypothetical protein